MKQTPLRRTTPLKRSRVRSRADSYSRRVKDPDPAREAWKHPTYGHCQNCDYLDDQRPLHGHHVIARQVLARAGLPEYDARLRMNLCERCHMNSEFGLANRKIPIEKVPEIALAYAVRILGEAFVADYVRRHYNCETTL